MRLILLITLTLTTLGLALVEIDVPAATRVTAEVPWRYTPSGWERADWLTPEPIGSAPQLHPVVIGAGQILLVLLALVAFSGPSKKPSAAPTLVAQKYTHHQHSRDRRKPAISTGSRR